ncbi:fumarylacetoacetate hydrolase family protein [Amylibacter sp. SFDW26]|uniref:fumarylacetoacetate hydrolase family protein n=1 Tax=Amylibacter sp. SFDW26 TaxID=2652722 RepID=UPI001261C915|nr:fumarylacetoacetate hydrolase family protein [Amylibacter sp. SFDW26]KAB7616314.1 fumarylacetoacetate hydrolase family protein [Amylibacter sp. SFDW26]
MKLLRYGPEGSEKPGCLDADGNIRDLSAHTTDFVGNSVSLENIGKLKAIDTTTLPLVDGDVRIARALRDVPNFFCIGLNYAKHAAETGSELPPEPLIFNKATSALNDPFGIIQIPRGSKHVDWEVELGVVIGKEASYVSEADALDYVAAYCTINDVSERVFQKHRGGQWVKGKSAPTFGPVGPYLVTCDEVSDPQNLNVNCSVNGEMQQNSNTSDMIFSVAQIISAMSQYFTLRVGDIIATGTPEGVGAGKKPQTQFMRDGDVIVTEVEGLGAQRHTVKGWG